MNNIVSNEKVELKYNDDTMEFILAVYDVYGHYIDEITLSRDDVREIYEGLDGVKDKFIR